MAAGKMNPVYMGPKDPETGERPDHPPPYIHQAVPVWLYHPEWPSENNGRLVNSSDEAQQMLADGWSTSPAAWGKVTEPSPQDRASAQMAAFRAKAPAELTAAEVAKAEAEAAEKAAFEQWKKDRAGKAAADDADKAASADSGKGEKKK